MKKVNFGYSVKNILISSERTYLLQRIEKDESNTDGNEIKAHEKYISTTIIV